MRGEPSAAPASPDLLRRIDAVMWRDQRRLRHASARARDAREPQARARQLARLEADLAAAEARLAARRGAVPQVTYPPQLPVSQERQRILEAIRDHQVVVVAGETGSGKTTQLPKICLELGRGVRGMIGHTQPRRLAARTVAERVAEELGTTLGEAVGYTVRFTDQVGDRTLVKLMTDGILLAEVQRDRLLTRYDTLIIDEAHERSLNIDFLLGYLAQLLPRRPDLKVVVTSATIDPQRFADHFGGAPVIEVSGRTYPVEVRYRPLVPEALPSSDSLPADDEDAASAEPRDQVTGIVDAVRELCAEGPGDVLVFLSGEREIRDTADALRGALDGDRRGPPVEVLPLYARLSSADQHRVFAPHTGRRVVLATNVAETSLTVPGIRYVVDPGTARISRYSHRTKVQRLPIEPVSQASANQRKGRCGRVAAGVCIRLYSEDDFASRPEFTDPEILRTNLASVILQMTALGLGDIAAFPFVEPPDRRQVRDGVQLLEELGALRPGSDGGRRLTDVGRQLAQLPVDPRIARMVLAGAAEGCLREVLVIAAAMSIQDPRERPVDHQQAADEAHRRFADPTSDFLAYLNLWNYLREQQKSLSSSQFRRMCKREFLSYLRVREWQDLHSQLRQVTSSIGLVMSSGTAEPARVHSALLAGLLSHVGLRDERRREYQGARGARFAIFPGSSLAKKQPDWVVAAELVETSRLWGRTVAKIDPAWVEAQAGDLVRRSFSEPHWEARRGEVVAYEKVTLYGVPLVSGRKVGYARVDPELARELFIRHALVEGDWRTQHRFFHANRELLDDVAELEARARRRDIAVDDETLFSFYDKRIPADVVSGRHFDAWWKQARRTTPDLLTFTEDLLIADEAAPVDASDFPLDWRQGDLSLRVSYQFEPGTAADGVTVHVPLAVLNQVQPDGFDWQIPGLRLELVTALIRSLPKSVRRLLVPAPDTAAAVLQAISPEDGPLLQVLAAGLEKLRGVAVSPDDFDVDRLPEHLRVTFRVEDGHRAVAEGKDLDALRAQLRVDVRQVISRAADAVERTGLVAWPGGSVPRTFADEAAGHGVRGYPALVDEGSSVALRVLATPDEQAQAMRAGVRRLLLLQVPSVARQTASRLSNAEKLALSVNPHGSVDSLLADCTAAAVDAIVDAEGGPAWDEASFARLSRAVSVGIDDRVAHVVALVARVLTTAREVDRLLRGTTSLPLLPALADVRAQLEGLVFKGFVTQTSVLRLPDLLRYLHAMVRRLEKLPEDPRGDATRMQQVQRVQEQYERLLASQPRSRRVPVHVADIRWTIEELRVSLFAQQLGTAYPVSEQRIAKAIAAASAGGGSP